MAQAARQGVGNNAIRISESSTMHAYKVLRLVSSAAVVAVRPLVKSLRTACAHAHAGTGLALLFIYAVTSGRGVQKHPPIMGMLCCFAVARATQASRCTSSTFGGGIGTGGC